MYLLSLRLPSRSQVTEVAKDAEYVKNAVVQAVNDPDESMENDYSISVSLTVADGVFKAINVTSDDVTDDDSPYLNRAVNGTKTKPGIVSLEGQPATEDTINSWDGVSGATVASNAIKTAALEAINEAEEAEATPDPAPRRRSLSSRQQNTYTAQSISPMQTSTMAS